MKRFLIPLAVAIVALTNCTTVADGKGLRLSKGSMTKVPDRHGIDRDSAIGPDRLGLEIVNQLLTCWKQRLVFEPPADRYFPTFRIALNLDGTFARDPQLLNRPSSSSEESVAESGMAVLRRCQPLHLPMSLVRDLTAPVVRTVRFAD